MTDLCGGNFCSEIITMEIVVASYNRLEDAMD